MALLRNVCFTINNYTTEDLCLLGSDGLWSYIIAGFESGANGTPHIQGYGELTKRMRLSSVKKYLPRAHIEGRKGTQKQAIDYCMKEGSFVSHGDAKSQGKRTDLDAARQLASDSGMREVTQVCTLQQIKVAEKYLTYNEDCRDWAPDVYWIWGPTGTGKSRAARIICQDMDVFVKNDDSKWWDGYDGHNAVILDDFRPSWWPITRMLAILDRYECRLEIKGGWRQLLARTIVVTSAIPPNQCYTGTGESVKQLLRRINVIEHMVPSVPEVGGNTSTPTDLLEYLDM